MKYIICFSFIICVISCENKTQKSNSSISSTIYCSWCGKETGENRGFVLFDKVSINGFPLDLDSNFLKPISYYSIFYRKILDSSNYQYKIIKIDSGHVYSRVKRNNLLSLNSVDSIFNDETLKDSLTYVKRSIPTSYYCSLICFDDFRKSFPLKKPLNFLEYFSNITLNTGEGY